MKVGDVVKILESCSGPSGCYTGSTPFKDELVVVTEKNINGIEDLMRSGKAVLFSEVGKVTKVYLKEGTVKSETSDILPDVKTRTRSRKRNLQSTDEETV